MKSRASTIAAIVIAGLTLTAGCGPHSAQTADAPTPEAAPTPRQVTDLSTLSSARVDRFVAPPPAAQAAISAAVQDSGEGAQEFGNGPGMVHHVGLDNSPGEERLMNTKAAEFASLSRQLLDHLFNAVFKHEKDDRISRLKLPQEMKPVIITATLDKNGKLTELVLEQHSGKAMIDRMMLDACKDSLWYRNPPAAAATADGTYRLRLETLITNFASLDGTNWTFKTEIGLALL